MNVFGVRAKKSHFWFRVKSEEEMKWPLGMSDLFPPHPQKECNSKDKEEGEKNEEGKCW